MGAPEVRYTLAAPAEDSLRRAPADHYVFAFFAAAQRFLWASAIRLRPAAEMRCFFRCTDDVPVEEATGA